MPDKVLFVTASVIIAISIVMVYSLSAYIVLLFDYNEFHFVVRQFIFGVISILIMWSLAQLDPDVWLGRLGLTLFIGGFLLMAAMPFMPPFLVSEVGGAKRWIKVFGFSLAPVEFFKIGFVYFLAWSFSRKLGHHANMGIKKEYIRFIPYALLFVVIIILIALFQKDLGQVAVLGLSLLFMLMLAGSSFKFFISLISLSLIAMTVLIVTQEHRIARVKSWWASTQDFILAFFPESIGSRLRVEAFQEPYQIGHSSFFQA